MVATECFKNRNFKELMLKKEDQKENGNLKETIKKPSAQNILKHMAEEKRFNEITIGIFLRLFYGFHQKLIHVFSRSFTQVLLRRFL